MWWPFQWLVIYVLGGLTFVPLVIALIIVYVYKYGSIAIQDALATNDRSSITQSQIEKDEQLAKSLAATSSGRPLSGWLTVRRQFRPVHTGSSLFSFTTGDPTDPNGTATGDTVDGGDEELTAAASVASSGTSTPNPTAASGTNANGPTSRSESLHDTNTGPSGSGTNGSSSHRDTYSSRIAQTYRQVMEARQARKEPSAKENFYCILKGSVMFLYEDETQSECVAAIGVDKYTISVETREGPFAGKDGEMFARRNAVVMRILGAEDAPSGGEKKGLPVLAKGMEGENASEVKEMESAPWYLFTKSNIQLEDWYLALVQASAAHANTDDVFSQSDMQNLVDTIDTEPDPIPMRWLNAMFGRIFFGVYRTELLEQFIIKKIMKKLSKVPRPSFLGPIVVREVNVGTFPPIFSKPMLKDLTAQGTSSFEVHMSYHSRPSQPNSEVRITIATTATIPTGFKPYVVDLVLAVVLKSLEGNMVLQIKKPPSNRVWYGFSTMPKMEVEIIPVVSERKIQLNMVLKAIEKQLRDVIAESVVLPNMDDVAFFKTTSLDIRGAIFSSAGKKTVGPEKDLLPGDEESTQPGVDVATLAEDPSSATAEIPSIRLRRPAKSQTTETKTITPPTASTDSLAAPPAAGESLPRTETAPASLSSAPGARRTAAVEATKKWFASSGKPASITSKRSTQSNESQETLPRPSRAGASGRPESVLSEASSVHLEHDRPVSKSVPSLVESGQTAPIGEASDSASTSPRKDKKSLLSLSRTSSSDLSTTRSLETNDDPHTSARASAANLISSIRARDKQATIAQVSSAKDAVKKWGVTWAAKRRGLQGEMDERDETKPAAIYRPPDQDLTGTGHRRIPSDLNTNGLSKSPDGPRSPRTLKERLDAAAQVSTTQALSSDDHELTRHRSTSSASGRPSLISTSSADSRLGTSPPQWTLGSSAPTTEVAKKDVVAPNIASTSSLTSTSTTTSIGSMVSRQPAAGRGMVVPRIPVRPGIVTGMGSSGSGSGITRRISGSDRDEELEHPAFVDATPPLPPRPTQSDGDTPPELQSDSSNYSEDELKETGSESPPKTSTSVQTTPKLDTNTQTNIVSRSLEDASEGQTISVTGPVEEMTPRKPPTLPPRRNAPETSTIPDPTSDTDDTAHSPAMAQPKDEEPQVVDWRESAPASFASSGNDSLTFSESRGTAGPPKLPPRPSPMDVAQSLNEENQIEPKDSTGAVHDDETTPAPAPEEPIPAVVHDNDASVDFVKEHIPAADAPEEVDQRKLDSSDPHEGPNSGISGAEESLRRLVKEDQDSLPKADPDAAEGQAGEEEAD